MSNVQGGFHTKRTCPECGRTLSVRAFDGNDQVCRKCQRDGYRAFHTVMCRYWRRRGRSRCTSRCLDTAWP